MRKTTHQSVLCAFTAAALIGAVGCASILSGGYQELTFNSEPSGATVTVAGKELGKTPVTARVKRGDNQALVVEKEGYITQKSELPTKTNTFTWFNGIFLWWSPICSTTDANTGAVREYAIDKFMITLVPANGAGPLRVEDDQARKLKDFVFSGYRNIQTDVARGSGEYLGSLFTLLKVEQEGKKEALEKIRALSTLYKDIPTFADKLIETFLAGKQTTPTETK